MFTKYKRKKSPKISSREKKNWRVCRRLPDKESRSTKDQKTSETRLLDHLL